jgi:hypothetical protein
MLDRLLDITYLSDQGIGFYTWTPDSKSFLFWKGDNSKPLLGRYGVSPIPLTMFPVLPYSVKWVDDSCYLFVVAYIPDESGTFYTDAGLRLGCLDGRDQVISDQVGANLYDFTMTTTH